MPEDKVELHPPTDPKLYLQSRKMELDAGWVGRVIGSAKNAPNNIAFLVVTLVLIAGIVVSFVFPTDRLEFWKLILPIITLTLGYLFGKNTGS